LTKYLIDSNVCIYHFRQFPEVIHYMQEIFRQPNNEMLISVITEAELLSTPY
jgi:tRNA(fMet)-specific endonuclease VapC